MAKATIPHGFHSAGIVIYIIYIYMILGIIILQYYLISNNNEYVLSLCYW